MATAQERDYHNEARLLLCNVKSGSLATVKDGVPHAALVTVAFLPDFSPILLLSELAIHTRQLRANPAAALLLAGEASDENPQTTPRLCLSGTAAPAADPLARTRFLDRHPYAAFYAGFGDFACWRLHVTKSYYIGGFAAAAELDFGKLAG